MVRKRKIDDAGEMGRFLEVACVGNGTQSQVESLCLSRIPDNSPIATGEKAGHKSRQVLSIGN